MSRPNQFDAIQGLRAKRQQADRDLAAAILAVGMYLFEPKASDEELVIKRSFEE